MSQKVRNLVYLAIILAGYCVVSEMDYQDAVHQEQIAKAYQVQTYAAR